MCYTSFKTPGSTPTAKNDPAQPADRGHRTLGGSGYSRPGCQGDATADTPARAQASPQTGQASRRQCQTFLVLCDMAWTTP